MALIITYSDVPGCFLHNATGLTYCIQLALYDKTTITTKKIKVLIVTVA